MDALINYLFFQFDPSLLNHINFTLYVRLNNFGVLGNNFMNLKLLNSNLSTSYSYILKNFKNLPLETVYRNLPINCTRINLDNLLYNTAFVERVYKVRLINYNNPQDLLTDPDFFKYFLQTQGNVNKMCANPGHLFNSIQDANISGLACNLNEGHSLLSGYFTITANSSEIDTMATFLKYNYSDFSNLSYMDYLSYLNNSLVYLL
jgi:hypothetical protein